MLSFEVETAILYLPLLWPTAMEVIAARWLEIVRMGEFGWCWSRPDIGFVKERILTRDQTWMLASDDPETIKFEVGSTTREVTGCKCEGVVATCRPVQI